jgi:small conductance mechanosensitive channel
MRFWRRGRSPEATGSLLDTERARQLAQQAKERARSARREVVVITPLVVAVLFAYAYRVELFALDRPVRIAAVVALVVLGWFFASALGRALGPLLFRRLDPGTAGTVGFLIRLIAIAIAVLVALRVAGLRPGTLATGGAVVSILFGLAAQQTLGNLFAGTVLLSSQPFRLGDEIRLQNETLGDHIEGRVSTLGLLYTTLTRRRDSILVPNSVVLGSAIAPLREPTAVAFRARLRPGIRLSDVQGLLEELSTPVRSTPHIGLEEVESDEILVRIEATPGSEAEGATLADEILVRLSEVASDGARSIDGHGPAHEGGRAAPDGRAKGHGSGARDEASAAGEEDLPGRRVG